MAEQYANAVATTVATTMNNSQTTMSVTSATGFPTIGTFRVLISAEGANTNEIVAVTSVSGTTLTIVRAAEPYAGVQSASAHTSGAVVTIVLTAAALPGPAVNSAALIWVAQNFR